MGTGQWVQGNGYRAMGTGQWALGNGYLAMNRAMGTGQWVLGTARVSGNEFYYLGTGQWSLWSLVILFRSYVCPNYDNNISHTAVRGTHGAVDLPP